VRAGSTQPIANAQVTLSGNAIDIDKLETFVGNFFSVTKVSPANLINQISAGFNEHFQRTGLSGQPLTDAVARAMDAGLPASAGNAALEDRILQSAITVGKNQGVSPYSSDFSAVLRKARASMSAFKTMTDSSGHFVLDNVPAGQYVVRVERSGYFGPPGATPLQTASATVNVASGSANVTLSMRQGGTIGGRLRDESGLPMAGATVQALTVEYANGVPTLSVAADSKTDDRGEYSLFWLPPGDYIVATVRSSTSIVTTLTAPATLPKVIESFYPGTSSVTDAMSVVVRPGDNIEGIDFENRPAKPVKISGTVTTTLPPSSPQVNAALLLLQRDTTVPDDAGARQIATISMDSGGAKGSFEVALLPGSYDLFARILTPGGVVPGTFGRISLDVRDRDIKDVQVEVHPVVTGGGTLTINGVPPGESSGLRVLLRPNDSAAKLPAYAQVLMQRVTPVKADGSFSFPALYVGQYAVVVEGIPRGMYVADVQQGGTSVFDRGISVSSQPPNPLQVSIKTDAGMLQGTVLDFQKKPAPSATVVMIPPESRRQNRMLYWTATTDADGKFSIPGVAPGIYKAFAWLNLPAGAYFNPKLVAKYESSGRTITVAASTTLNTELTAIPLE